MTDDDAKKIAKKVSDSIAFWIICALWAVAIMMEAQDWLSSLTH